MRFGELKAAIDSTLLFVMGDAEFGVGDGGFEVFFIVVELEAERATEDDEFRVVLSDKGFELFGDGDGGFLPVVVRVELWCGGKIERGVFFLVDSLGEGG